MPGFSQRAGKLRRPTWLRQHRYGPNVYIFRNLETNQVLYTQLPFPQQYNIKKQFQGPNWQNRLPSLRNDLWRPMAVAQTRTYESAVDLYEKLVQLRHMRDYTHNKQANAMRKKNKDGNIWYFSQFRPTYTQEAVADVISSLEHLNVPAKIHWEDAWRRGDQREWETVAVDHENMPRYNPRERHVVLRKIADESYKAYFENLNEINKQRMKELVKPQIIQKTKIKVQKEAAGGPSKKWDSSRLSSGIERKTKDISLLHSRAQTTKNYIESLPNYGNVHLKRRLRAEAKAEFAVLRRVQRELERYKRARAAQKQLERLKATKKQQL